MRTARYVLLGTLALLVGAGLVPAAQAKPGPRDGIAHARAAGINIDPRVEHLMARAPVGSCANDPTLAKCPTIHAVVFRATTGLARLAQIPQCAVNLGGDPSSPYKAAGYAQADGKYYDPVNAPAKWFLRPDERHPVRCGAGSVPQPLLRVSTIVVHVSWEGTTLTLDDEHAVLWDGEELGEQGGDFTPFLIDLDGQRHVIVAGESLDRRTRYVYVNERPTPVNPEAVGRPWMVPPLPFSHGMTITAVGRAELDGDELWRLESPPLTEDRPEPVFGPGWTRYSPLTS